MTEEELEHLVSDPKIIRNRACLPLSSAALPLCLVCGLPSERIVCADCAKELEKELFFEEETARMEGESFKMVSISLYQGLMREALNEYKFSRRKKLAALFGALVREGARAIAAKSASSERDPLLLFAPASRKGQRTRGFNQVELALAESGMEYCEAIFLKEKSANGREQKTLDRTGRIAAAKNKYIVNPDILIPHASGKDLVICCDDIWTTGSTLMAIMSQVRAVLDGARLCDVSVWGCVFARAKDALAF